MMKIKTKLMLGAATLAATIVGIAYATPIVGLASPLFSVGQHSANIETHGSGLTPGGQRFRVELETEGPATISNQDGAYAAGGHNGWHSHPGMVAVTIISGAIQWFDENCVQTDYKAGDSWTEGSKVHYFRVVGTTGLHLTAFFITAQGAALRTDEGAPACAAALGLQ
jgi:quercetin dioxygenase-like cupin family protein